MITPLALDDPEAALSELSDAELACLGGDTGKLARALVSPGSETQEEQAKLFQCLEDETVGRIFLAGFVGDSGPLSLETSTCVRAAFEEIDPRAIMTAGAEGDPGTAMAGSMAGFAVNLTCLNDEEWEATAPKVGLEPSERDEMKCVLKNLGGPTEMAAAFKAANEGDFTGLAQAGMDCGLDMGPVPGQAPVAPTGGHQTGIISPLVLDNANAVAAQLSEAELACLGGDAAKLTMVLTGPGSTTQEEQAEIIGCLEDETVSRMFLAGFLGDSGDLSLETSNCVRAAFQVIDPRAVMLAGAEGDPGAAMAGSMTAFTVTLACLNDDEWMTAASTLGMGVGEQEGMQCVLAALGGPTEMAAAMTAANRGDPTVLSQAWTECGLIGEHAPSP